MQKKSSEKPKLSDIENQLKDDEGVSYRRHERDTLRIKYAGRALIASYIGIAIALALGVFYPVSVEKNIYSIFISSLFGIMTLILGFIAGSGIDRD